MEKYTLIDDLGTKHVFDKVPQRIVSLVPSQTELLVDLGLESKLLGITKFCIHPTHLRKEKVVVGGTKQVDFEKIKSLAPDIVIANKEENTREIVETLRALCPVWVTDIKCIEDNFKMISDFGQLFHCIPEAETWNAKIRFSLNIFTSFIAEKPFRKVAYFIWKNPYMLAGSANYINALLQLNRFENVFDNQSRYPVVTPEEISVIKKIDYLLLSSEPYPFKEKDAVEMAAMNPSAKVILVDGEMFSWHGSRLLKAFEYFMSLH